MLNDTSNLKTNTTGLQELLNTVNNLPVAGGSGDMEQSVYDTNGDGVVDNAERLGGVDASAYVKTEDLGSLATKSTVDKNDLSEDIQQSLNKANTAIQSVDGLATEDYVDQAITDHTLIGSTTELTPTAVVDAVATGRNVILAHTDATFGLLAANHFTFSPDDQTVLATSVVPYGGGYVAYALIGFLSSNTWNSMYTVVAEQEKVDAAIAELSEGFENVIFQMYGSDFDTENETAPTIRQIANDEATTALNAAKEYTGTYVDDKVASLVDSSPETLDTLNELAAALGDDPNFATTVATEIGKKVDKVSGKGLSTNDYTTAEKNKLAGIAEGANKTVVDSALSSTSTNPVQNKVINSALAGKVDTSTTVNGHALSGNVTVTKSDVGLGNVDNTSDANKPVSTAQQTAINEAVNTAKTYTDTVAEGKADKSQAIFYIQGGGTTDTTNKKATWTGSHSDITEYYDGLMIAYKVGTAASTTTTLNINNLGAVTVVRNVTTAVSTAYGINAIVLLTYTTDSSGTSYWKVADYDSDTKTRSSNKADTKMYIIGASSQSTSGQTTYSNSKCYIGADNCLYSDGKKVATADAATADSAGLMSADDKEKLDSIPSELPRAFYITVTQTGADSYSVDKTGQEIVDAYDAGCVLIAYDGSDYHYCTSKYTETQGDGVDVVINSSTIRFFASNTDYNSVITIYVQVGKNGPNDINTIRVEYYKSTMLVDHLGNSSNPHNVTLTQLGVNATADELNYVDGVTSNIQTQLNAKAGTSVATTSNSGLMSAADKTKLDGIATGANKTVIDSALSSSSINPVQNKVVNTALAEKMNTTNPTATGSFSLNRKEGSTVGSDSFAEGRSTTASGTASHAEGQNTEATKNQAHAEGFATTASKAQAHAEGYYSTASGVASHAEGDHTISSGANSHAEGSFTTAIGDNSHAEGQSTKAVGSHAHAEGYGINSSTSLTGDANATTYTTNSILRIGDVISYGSVYATVVDVNKTDKTITLNKTLSAEAALSSTAAGHPLGISSGNYSHSEGSTTTASGESSHAEGTRTLASGNNSHAEGDNTIAHGYSQHVQGKYNIEDTENKYAHIVGNGGFDTPSNAHTLDWNGNGWFAGQLKVGGTGQDDTAAKTIATLDDIPENVQSDWNQMDETAPDYVKNRTHYAEGSGEVVFTGTVNIRRPDASVSFSGSIASKANQKYSIIWDGTLYVCTSYIDSENYLCIGAVWDDDNQDWNYSEFPFVVYTENVNSVAYSVQANVVGTHTIVLKEGVIHQLDEKFIPDTIARNIEATSSSAGLMSAEDKTKLDSIKTGLPTVTTSDDGAFLRVVNGAWAAVQLPNVEEGEF